MGLRAQKALPISLQCTYSLLLALLHSLLLPPLSQAKALHQGSKNRPELEILGGKGNLNFIMDFAGSTASCWLYIHPFVARGSYSSAQLD